MDQQVVIDRAFSLMQGNSTQWSFGGLPLNDEGLDLLARQHPNASALFLWMTNVSDAGVRAVNKLPNLKVLATQMTQVTSKFLEELNQSLLESLQITGDQFTVASATRIANLPRLNELRIEANIVADQVESCEPSDNLLRIIGECPSLQRLETYGLRLTGSCIPSLAKLPLTKLELRATYCPAESLKALSACTSVSRLRLDYSGLDDETLAILLDAMDLEELSIENTAITSRSIDRIIAMPNLFSLDVDASTLGEEGFLKLAKMKSLDYLTCRGMPDAERLTEKFKEIRGKLIILELK